MPVLRSAALAAALVAGVLCSLGASAHMPEPSVAAAPEAPADVRPPLDSRAKLDAWLRANRGKPSPLDAFSAGGRQRFLAGLGYGERGVVSLPFEDLTWELDQAQAQAVLALLGLGDDPIATTLRTDPVPPAWRGDRKAPSDIDRRYTQYIALTGAVAEGDASTRARHMDALYRQLFPKTLVEQADKLTDPDLLLLARAAANAAGSGSDQSATQDLLALLVLLEQRGMERGALIQDTQRALLASGKLDDARALTAQHPAIALASIPAVGTPADALPTGPRWWRLSADATRMDAESADLAQTQILSSPAATSPWMRRRTSRPIPNWARSSPGMRIGSASHRAWKTSTPGRPGMRGSQAHRCTSSPSAATGRSCPPGACRPMPSSGTARSWTRPAARSGMSPTDASP
ncbi:hypothetical protein [Pseudoxanthomonas sp. UC19_8]|uniref:hypothetical protein n=1 Tax=Pseudoxanthomonas sp. UC19_8 TaxID=3350175 RepID=UPI0036D2AB42